jgi:small ligand-binding sensory domain FIST
MGWLDIFTGDKADKAIDAVVNTGDALFFTDEEKSQASQKKLELMIEHAKAMGPSRQSRRYLVWVIAGNFSLMAWAGVAFKYFDNKEMADYLFEMINTGKIGWAFVGVVTYYFLAAPLKK